MRYELNQSNNTFWIRFFSPVLLDTKLIWHKPILDIFARQTETKYYVVFGVSASIINGQLGFHVAHFLYVNTLGSKVSWAIFLAKELHWWNRWKKTIIRWYKNLLFVPNGTNVIPCCFFSLVFSRSISSHLTTFCLYYLMLDRSLVVCEKICLEKHKKTSNYNGPINGVAEGIFFFFVYIFKVEILSFNI